MTIEEVAKFAIIQARQGAIGEEIVTKMANGLEETKEEFITARQESQQETSSKDVRNDKIIDTDEQEL